MQEIFVEQINAKKKRVEKGIVEIVMKILAG